jgi:hypothetical protein
MFCEITNIQAHLPSGRVNKVDLLLSQEFRGSFNATNLSSNLMPVRIDWWKCDGDATDSSGNAPGKILGVVPATNGMICLSR